MSRWAERRCKIVSGRNRRFLTFGCQGDGATLDSRPALPKETETKPRVLDLRGPRSPTPQLPQVISPSATAAGLPDQTRTCVEGSVVAVSTEKRGGR